MIKQFPFPSIIHGNVKEICCCLPQIQAQNDKNVLKLMNISAKSQKYLKSQKSWNGVSWIWALKVAITPTIPNSLAVYSPFLQSAKTLNLPHSLNPILEPKSRLKTTALLLIWMGLKEVPTPSPLILIRACNPSVMYLRHCSTAKPPRCCCRRCTLSAICHH